MIQEYTQENNRGKSGCPTRIDFISNVISRRKSENQTFVVFCSYTCEVSYNQWSPYIPEKQNCQELKRLVEKLEGAMLSVTGIDYFYHMHDFTDIRCKHNLVLSIIREQFHRESNAGDVFNAMFSDCRIV